MLEGLRRHFTKPAAVEWGTGDLQYALETGDWDGRPTPEGRRIVWQGEATPPAPDGGDTLDP